MKKWPWVMAGAVPSLVIGCLATILFLYPSISTKVSDNCDMSKFLISLHAGQAVAWDNLPVGTYRAGPEVDRYTRVLFRIAPLGDIPMLVRDVPEGLIRDDRTVRKFAPEEPS